MGKPRVLILGGGFGGMYAALQFEHMLARGGEQYRQPNPQVVTSRDILPRRHRIYRPRGKWQGKEGLLWQPTEKRS